MMSSAFEDPGTAAEAVGRAHGDTPGAGVTTGSTVCGTAGNGAGADAVTADNPAFWRSAAAFVSR